jgi:protease-4
MCFAGGCGMPSLLITPVYDTRTLQEQRIQGSGWARDKIAIVEVEGMLLNARTGGFLEPPENKVSLFVQQLEQAATDPRVKAVVLRINSPGGTVTASDTMYRQVLRFREETGKPVIASAQDVAASGAYYVACAADRVVVQPTSVVGSIGVIFNTFNLAGTLEKIGIKTDAIKSGPYKDMGSPFRGIKEDERALMQKMVDDYYQRFVSVVTTHRKVSDLKTATDGRVFTGDDAVKLGLADETGDLEDAIALARKMTNSPKAAVVMYKRSYGYSGSIYASTPTHRPAPAVVHVELPELTELLPRGFYYLWEP